MSPISHMKIKCRQVDWFDLPGQKFSSQDLTLAHLSGDCKQHFGFLICLRSVADVVTTYDGTNVVHVQSLVADATTVMDKVVSVNKN